VASMCVDSVTYASTFVSADELEKAGCAVIVTKRDCLDYEMMRTHCRLVLDTRNAMSVDRGCKARVVKL